MKRLIICSIIVLLLLSSCTKAPQQQGGTETNSPDTTQFDPTPAKDTSKKVVVEGKTLQALYTVEQTEYVSLTEIADILQGTLTTDKAEKAPYTASLSVKGNNFTLSTETDTLTQGETEHPLVHTPIYDGKSWYVALQPIMSLLSLQCFEDSENDTLYYTFVPMNSDIAKDKRIPVLMYHAVGEQPWSSITGLFVRPTELEKQLSYLSENGYTTITFEDFYRLDEIEKPVMLTFDDGYDDNYSELFPLLKKYNAKATVFVITELMGTEHYLTQEQIKEMSDSGLVSIQSHTVSHPFLSDLDEQELKEELTTSQRILTRITQKQPFVLCYPTGKYSSLSLEKTKESYQYGLLMNGGMYNTSAHSPYLIPRYYISRTTSLDAFISKLG